MKKNSKKYQHYKTGQLYEVIGIAHHSETKEEMVVYRGLYNCNKFGKEPWFVRPKKMFFEEVLWKENSFSREISEQYFDPDTLLVINGKTVYRGYAQLESHFEVVKKNIRGQIKFPFLEIIGVDDRLIVRFDENISDNQGRQYPGNVIAIFTLRNGKIWKWEQVVNSAYFCQETSQKIVYAK